MKCDAVPKDGLESVVVRLIAENQFEAMLLNALDCASPTFRFDGSCLVAEISDCRS